MLVLEQLAQRADKEHQPLLRKLRLANDQPLALDLFVVGAHQARGAHIRALAGHFAPELYSENSIGNDPLPPGQAWVISAGGGEEHPGLYQVDVTEGPGSGVKILLTRHTKSMN